MHATILFIFFKSYRAPCSQPQISNEPGNQYNVAAINALVLFVGTQAITFVHSKGQTPSTSSIAHTAHMDIFQHMVVDLDTEGVCVCVCVSVSVYITAGVVNHY